MTRIWTPFRVDNDVLLAPRPLSSKDTAGIGDRLRTAAFAEMQAEAAFLWAAETYNEAPEDLKKAWRHLAVEEHKHMNWLLARMTELNIALDERPVSDGLWQSLLTCKSAKDFCHYIADAEERGRKAGERFSQRLANYDPLTARIFAQIALEESGHIALAYRHYPKV